MAEFERAVFLKSLASEQGDMVPVERISRRSAQKLLFSIAALSWPLRTALCAKPLAGRADAVAPVPGHLQRNS